MPELLKSQKATLFEWIKGWGELNPAVFELTTMRDEQGEIIGNTLRYKGGAYYFSIDSSTPEFRLTFSPGIERIRERHATRSFEQVVVPLADWLGSLQREIIAPDPWAAMSQYSTLAQVSPASDTPNTPFTYPELETIWKGLTAIQSTLLIHASESVAQQSLVKSQIAFLVESSKRAGRRDWLLMAVGTFVTIVTAMSMSPEVARQIFQQLRDAVNGIVYIVPLLV